MFCPKCGKENPDTNQYCGKCGGSLKIYTQQSSEKLTPSHIENQHDKINEQQNIQAKSENKIAEFIQYIGWGPFILIVLGLFTIWAPMGFIFILLGVAWAFLGHQKWNVNVRLNGSDTDKENKKSEDYESEDDDFEPDEDDDEDYDDDDEDYDDDFTGRGYCIRCGRVIRENPNKPLCSKCYSIWSQYSNPYYPENFCHICGRGSNQSYSKPVCYKCYKKYFD
jgi:hypothetical protein